MANDIRLFKNEEFGEVRTMVINDEPWFVGKDIADILGYSAARNALASHVAEEDKLTHQISASGQKRDMIFINESGLYSLILSSKLPKAKEFKHWVTSEVLPDIRKYGMYMNQQTAELLMNDPRAFAQVLNAYADAKDKIVELEAENAEQKEVIENQNEQIEVLTPKGEYYDLVINSPGALNIGVIARDYGLTARRLNAMLHEWGIQYRNGKTWVLYSKYADKGYVKSETYADENVSAVHTKWTQKGRYFIYENMKAHGILPLAEREEDDQKIVNLFD